MNLSRHNSTDRSSNFGWVARVVRGTIDQWQHWRRWFINEYSSDIDIYPWLLRQDCLLLMLTDNALWPLDLCHHHNAQVKTAYCLCLLTKLTYVIITWDVTSIIYYGQGSWPHELYISPKWVRPPNTLLFASSSVTLTVLPRTLLAFFQFRWIQVNSPQGFSGVTWILTHARSHFAKKVRYSSPPCTMCFAR